MGQELIGVVFDPGEFEAAFPTIAAREDLNKSDKVRVALGLDPRRASPGAPKGNQNAVGNRGRWASGSQIGFGQRVDRIVSEEAEALGVLLADYDPDYIRDPGSRIGHDRGNNYSRRFWTGERTTPLEVPCRQTDFDEDTFRNGVRNALRTLKSELDQ
jgi:hypothetical protein